MYTQIVHKLGIKETLILLQPMNYDFSVMFPSNSLQIRPMVIQETHIYSLCYGRDMCYGRDQHGKGHHWS